MQPLGLNMDFSILPFYCLSLLTPIINLITLWMQIQYFNISIYIFYRVIDTAASQLTKTAVTVTAIFIVALGYDSWYYLLGYTGATQYRFNTPIQIIGQ